MEILTENVVPKSLGIASTNPSWFTGLNHGSSKGAEIKVKSPANNEFLGAVNTIEKNDYEAIIQTAEKAFLKWRMVPAPKRGEIIRQYGDTLRRNKEALGKLVSLEMGKIYQEGLGEVQEMIDICDFSVGLSRQLYGLTMHSERPGHRMYEQYHPLGIVGIISAFNFPVAVWAWNAMLAAICGNVSIWKPSEKTPLTAIACFQLLKEVLEKNQVPEGVFNLVIGDRETGKWLSADKRIPLLSATGSTIMGKAVGKEVAERLGRSLLELGGNNAIILSENADLKLAMPAVLFGAIGTCGQRCTTTRRLIIHESIYEKVKESLIKGYTALREKIGHPLDAKTLIGPLIDAAAVKFMQARLAHIEKEGGRILFGGEVLSGPGFESGNFVVPALVEAKNEMSSVQEETFAPILYLLTYKNLEEAIAIQNAVPQGLSSSIFTNHFREAEQFLSHSGSDCGIANVNIGTSGAEIGGAFGGEKETGGGRESGSDSWKVYMRRQTNTLNWSEAMPLAQGIKFDI